MTILKKLTLLTIATISLKAQTTMCFIENHSNVSTADTVKLNGAICKGSKSAQEMQNEGWSTDDIKINNNNYIYIFKNPKIYFIVPKLI